MRKSCFTKTCTPLKDKSHLSKMVSVFPRHVPRYTKTSRLYVFGISTKTSKLPKTDWTFSDGPGWVMGSFSYFCPVDEHVPLSYLELIGFVFTSEPQDPHHSNSLSSSPQAEFQKNAKMEEGLWYEIETWSGVSEGQSIPWQRVPKRFRGNWILALHGRLIRIRE